MPQLYKKKKINVKIGIVMFYWSNRKSKKFEWDASGEEEAT